MLRQVQGHCIAAFFSETTNLETTTVTTTELPEEWTDNGKLCESKCIKDGEAYHWCVQVGGQLDYCTPGKLSFIFFPF